MTPLTALYLSHRRTFIFKLLPYVHSFATAEDLVQEAFMKALSRQHQFDGEKSQLKTWFTKILFSCLWDYMRADRKKPKTTGIDDASEADLACYDDNVDLEEHIVGVKSPAHKEVLMAYFIKGCSPQEVASVQDVTQDNVRKIVQRFREKVK